jgi:hypothetical protein
MLSSRGTHGYVRTYVVRIGGFLGAASDGTIDSCAELVSYCVMGMESSSRRVMDYVVRTSVLYVLRSTKSVTRE